MGNAGMNPLAREPCRPASVNKLPRCEFELSHCNLKSQKPSQTSQCGMVCCAKRVRKHGASARNVAMSSSSKSTARPHKAQAAGNVGAARMRAEKAREDHPPTQSPKSRPQREPCWRCRSHKLIANTCPIGVGGDVLQRRRHFRNGVAAPDRFIKAASFE